MKKQKKYFQVIYDDKSYILVDVETDGPAIGKNSIFCFNWNITEAKSKTLREKKDAHARLIHTDGVDGFSETNLKKISDNIKCA